MAVHVIGAILYAYNVIYAYIINIYIYIRVYSIDASIEKMSKDLTFSCLDLDLNPNFNFGSDELKKSILLSFINHISGMKTLL